MKKLFNNIYEKKKVLVTGHTGFKGSWLILWLKQLGAEIIGYSLEPPTKPSLFETLKLDKEIVHIIGDIRDEKKTKRSFQKISTRYSYTHGSSTISKIFLYKP